MINILDRDSVTKSIETAMDFLEFTLSTMPELIIEGLEEIIMTLLKLLQNKKESISNRANDLLNLAQEILSAELMLPQLVSVLDSLDGNQQ